MHAWKHEALSSIPNTKKKGKSAFENDSKELQRVSGPNSDEDRINPGPTPDGLTDK